MEIIRTKLKFKRLMSFFVHVSVFVCSTGLSALVCAETLEQSLLSAYHNNPQLDAERAWLRSKDETFNLALSNYRPNVLFEASASATRYKFNTDHSNVSNLDRDTTYPTEYRFIINQQVFRGFRTQNAANEARANILAGREALRATEQNILLNVIKAYMNVVRETSIVELSENSVYILNLNLKATKDRFSVGEVTKTDVAQSRARHAMAVSDLELAKANLKSSRANYEQLIGYSPNRLKHPKPPFSLLPKTLAEVRKYAELENPNVLAALHSERAAFYKTKEISGELLPTLNVQAQYSAKHTIDGSQIIKQEEAGAVSGTLKVPFYQRGAVSARLRQAKHLHIRSIKLAQQARNEARENAIAAWAQLVASRTQLLSAKALVEANILALSGVREEEKVGQRTLLDVLNAEQELLRSQVSLISNRRNLIVNSYTIMSIVGRLTALNLKLTPNVYNAKAHYDKIRRKWYGVDINYEDGKHEHFVAKDNSK